MNVVDSIISYLRTIFRSCSKLVSATMKFFLAQFQACPPFHDLSGIVVSTLRRLNEIKEGH
jgi:hypothetical protein